MIYTYLYNGNTYQINIEALPDGAYRVVIEDREYQVEASTLQNGGLKLLMNGKRHTVYTATQGKNRYVKADGESAQALTVPDQQSSRRRGSSAGSGALMAQMPGQVVDVYGNEGDTVTAGQTLIVLEAMKMEIRVSAPYDGILKRMLVKKGDVVEREQLLAEVVSAIDQG